MNDVKVDYKWELLPCCCCGSDRYKPLGYRGGAAHRAKQGTRSLIVKCIGCGHIYPRPMPLPKDISAQYSQSEHYFIQHDADSKINKYNALLERFERRLGFKGRLLDVGSGRGEMLHAAKTRGWDCCGVETCKEFADLCRSKYQADVKNCSLEEAKLPADYFDVVILDASIEHLHYPKRILLDINRVTKEGGFLWIDTSNEMSFYHIVGNIYFKITGRDWVTQLSPTFSPYHVQGFTKKSITLLLLRMGFSVEYLELYSGSPLLPHSGFKQFMEYLGVSLVSAANKVLKMGRVMEIGARKVKSVNS